MTAPALPGAAPDPARLPEAVQRIRAYAVESAATCREAERARASDIANRAENHAILPMLREQHYSWGAKAKSYDALVAFIDALPAAALGGDGEPVAWAAFNVHGTLVTSGTDESDVRAFAAAEERIYPAHNPVRVVPLYTRPAATGDTGEVEKARAKVVDAAMRWERDPRRGLATHLSMADLVTAVDELHAALRAATGDHPSEARRGHESEGRGGPDAR